MKKILILSVLLLPALSAFSQDPLPGDSIIVEKVDTVLVQSYAKRYNPRKALLFAAIAPGLGQIYNKKYWKLPLVYGGFYLIGNGISYYNDLYKQYREELFYNLENNLKGENDEHPITKNTTGQLRRAVDRSLRERDFMIILMGGMYLLQMIDAHVDAHLKEFDLNPNLQVSIEPTLKQDALIGKQTGVSVIFKF